MRLHPYITQSLALCGSLLLSLGVHAMPNGNYGETCRGCFMDGHALVCRSCLDRNQFGRSAALPHARSCRFVQNRNGRLVCTDGHRHRNKRWINAGPILSQFDANRTCPRVCANHNRIWNGQWRTIKGGRTSTCQCRK